MLDEEVGAAGLEKDGVMGVMDHAHSVGLGVADGNKGFAMFRRGRHLKKLLEKLLGKEREPFEKSHLVGLGRGVVQQPGDVF
jgi:hypothetical protein